jgi:VWFA-related protein
MSTTRNNVSSKIIRAIAAAFVATLLTAQMTSAQEPAPGKPISVYLTVEQNGNLVQGMRAGNFRLFEDGQARQFKLEDPQTPVSIALLVENSQTSYYYYWGDIQAAVQGFMDVAPSENWYALASFAHQLHVDVDFTKRVGRIGSAFSDLQAPMWNDIDTYDAVYGMLEKMGKLPGRKVLIVIGSGFDSGFSSHTLEDVMKEVEAVDVTVYGVAAGADLRGMYQSSLGQGSQMTLLQAQNFFQSLAEKSGGQSWAPMEQGAYPDIMKGIVQSLQNQYRLVYVPEPASKGKFDKIKVEAFVVKNDKRTDYKVRVRDGWRFGYVSD